jgi:TolB-like protein/class 3 adenylate cyclase/Tfp pilus assembly protein PilF
MPEDRRLAAIMFTDIVGYSKLMGEDEDKAFKILRKNREIQRPIIKKYHGEWLKEMGDGILASFHTSSDAVRCAGEIQQAAKKEGIGLRIGIHEGEVVFEGGDVLGDGVNVASRLEELAEEGAINISGSVYKDIKNKAGITAEFIEEKTLKNVDEPVKVYQVKCKEPDEELLDEKPSMRKKNKLLLYTIGGLTVVIIGIIIWQFLPVEKIEFEKTAIVDKSIAVKPFTNDSPDEENEYFCNGMMEDILTNLQRISDLKVKSRTDVEQYRDNKKTIATMGAELGVAYILEGSVRKAGDNLRITAQLIDVKTGDHLWASTYDGKYTDEIFKFQSEVAEMVASSLKAVITPIEEERLEKKPTTETIAYDYLIRGRDEIYNFWRTRDIRQLKLAHKLIDKALEIDSQYLDAIAIKGNAYIADKNYDSAYLYARRLLEIDSKSAEGYYLMGEYYRFIGEIDAAINNYLLTVEHYKKGDLLPINITNVVIGVLYCQQKNDYLKGLPFIQKGLETEYFAYSAYLGGVFAYIGDFHRADSHTKRMITLDPTQSKWYTRIVSEKLFLQDKFNQALIFLDSICSITLNEDVCNRQLFFAYEFLNNSDKSEYYLNQFISNNNNYWHPRDSIWIVYKYLKVDKNKDAIQFLNNYRISLENRLSGNISNWVLLNLSAIHAMLNEKEKSLRYLSEAVELGQGSTIFRLIEYYPFFENLKDDPEFKTIIEHNNDKLEKVQAQINQMRERGEITF